MERTGTGPGRRRRRAEAGSRLSAPDLPEAMVSVLVRALGLERAALLVEDETGGRLVAVATHGDVTIQPLRIGDEPADGPWSATLPVDAGSRTRGLLLLARPHGGALSAADRALANRLAEAAGRMVEHTRMAADLERSRALLARAERLSALGTLAAGVAHEIRNPLVSVRTFIQLLPERAADEEFRTAFRDLALSEIERICGLINDLLAFSRPAPAKVEMTDLNELADQIVRLLDAEARKHDVTVTFTPEPTLPMAVVDDAQIKQVVMNVLLNAIEACTPRGTVQVSTHADESDGEAWCLLMVSDSGPGIAAEHVGRIFDPFFTTKDTGSGLGLFIAHQIVTEHGGDIRTASREMGGTVFEVRIPVRARRRDADG